MQMINERELRQWKVNHVSTVVAKVGAKEISVSIQVVYSGQKQKILSS